MRLRSIYNIKGIHDAEDGIHVNISFNPAHEVFRGHFPGNPVVPGVIQIQIIKDILESHFNRRLFLAYSRTIKYLNMISPVKTADVNIHIKVHESIPEQIKASATITAGETTFTKFSGEFKVINDLK